jgi:hypothetical protein
MLRHVMANASNRQEVRRSQPRKMGVGGTRPRRSYDAFERQKPRLAYSARPSARASSAITSSLFVTLVGISWPFSTNSWIELPRCEYVATGADDSILVPMPARLDTSPAACNRRIASRTVNG